jgi:hypothetical protein
VRLWYAFKALSKISKLEVGGRGGRRVSVAKCATHSGNLKLTLILVVSSFGYASLAWQDDEFEDFVFIIPPDCPASTPATSRKRALRKCSAGSCAAASAGVDPH